MTTTTKTRTSTTTTKMIVLLFMTLPCQAFLMDNNNNNNNGDHNNIYFFQKIKNDFLALTRRVTAYHILVPNEQIAMTLKQRIREEAYNNNEYIVTTFQKAAKKYSQEPFTKRSGGLLGILIPQGYISSRNRNRNRSSSSSSSSSSLSSTLDRACFEVELGQLVGPIFEQSNKDDNEQEQDQRPVEDGYCHLLLVTERTNCPKLDGMNTKLIQGPLVSSASLNRNGENDGSSTSSIKRNRNKEEEGTMSKNLEYIYGTLVPSNDEEQVFGQANISKVITDLVTFWLLVYIAGGILATFLESIMNH